MENKKYKKLGIYANAVNHAKDLIDMPSNLLTPNDVADYVEKMCSTYQLEYEILDNEKLKEIGADCILAVNQGSQNEAKLICIKYSGTENEAYTALVGKGITFDSGGYNLKSS